MNKTLKKILALVLTVLMIMSVAAVGFVSFAEDGAAAEPEHRMFYEIFYEFAVDFFNFFKYIFYDVFRGVPAE